MSQILEMTLQRIIAEAMSRMPLEHLRGLVYVRDRKDFETLLAAADHVLIDYMGAVRDRLRDTFRIGEGGTLEFMRHNPDDPRELRGRAWNFIAFDEANDATTAGILRQLMKRPPHEKEPADLPKLFNFTL